VPEIIVDGETGLLVPMGDPQAMAEAVLRFSRIQNGRGRWEEEAGPGSLSSSHRTDGQSTEESMRTFSSTRESGRRSHSEGHTSHAGHSRFNIGGLQRVVVDLAGALHDRKYEVIVVAMRDGGPFSEELSRKNIRLYSYLKLKVEWTI